jgi:hypothetical protein
MINFEFTIEEANLILGALGRMPYESVFQLVDNMRNQAGPQVQALQEAAAEAAANDTVAGGEG